MSKTIEKYKVKVKTLDGESYTLSVYGYTENQARMNGRSEARRLLGEPVTVEWVKKG